MKIGVLGAGQLARMMALAGHPLGMTFSFVDPSAEACATALGPHIRAEFDSAAGLDALAADSDVLTYEFENVPAGLLARLARDLPVFPSPGILGLCQDRLTQKQLFEIAGVPSPEFAPVESVQDLEAAAERLGLPLVLKARRGGYDGRGQAVLRSADEAPQAWAAIGERPAIAETFIAFDREVSMIAARSRRGEMVFYPLCENRHREGMLRLTLSRPGDPCEQDARQLLARLMERLDYVGVATLEMFDVGGELRANELASRVHNSGHWTIEAAATSQFENHLRAIAGHPLGDTAPTGLAAMINCIGELPEPRAVLRQAGAHLHVYGKAPHPRRKIGHVTVCAEGGRELHRRLRGLVEAFPGVPELRAFVGDAPPDAPARGGPALKAGRPISR